MLNADGQEVTVKVPWPHSAIFPQGYQMEVDIGNGRHYMSVRDVAACHVPGLSHIPDHHQRL